MRAGFTLYRAWQDPRDGVGEVAANGRNVFMGYLDDPSKTRHQLSKHLVCSFILYHESGSNILMYPDQE